MARKPGAVLDPGNDVGLRVRIGVHVCPVLLHQRPFVALVQRSIFRISAEVIRNSR